MESEPKLRIYGDFEFESGGYEGEEHGSDRAKNEAIDPGEAGMPHEYIGHYFYRDSNELPGTDTRSSKVNVEIRQVYTWNRAKGNHFQINVKSYLTSIVRSWLVTTGGKIERDPARVISVFDANGQVRFGPRTSYINVAEEIFKGNIYLGETDYDLGPASSTPTQYLVKYQNYTYGLWDEAGRPVPSEFLDQIRMGLAFVNNLPAECDPPQFISANQTDNICENTVDACLTFAPCTCEGMALVLEYILPGQDWNSVSDRGQVIQQYASWETNNVVCIDNLPPTNHINEPMILTFRAKYIPLDNEMPETKWTTESIQLIFVLAPHETVPDISQQECVALGRGELIDKYNQEVCYNEFSCADRVTQTDDSALDKCKEVNGVSA